MESTVSPESLWLFSGDGSETEEGERPPLDAGTRGLVWDSKPRGLSACAVNFGQAVCNSDSAIDCNCEFVTVPL
jgi:hypothetical protein